MVNSSKLKKNKIKKKWAFLARLGSTNILLSSLFSIRQNIEVDILIFRFSNEL
jgi:hypothetical protein